MSKEDKAITGIVAMVVVWVFMATIMFNSCERERMRMEYRLIAITNQVSATNILEKAQ